MKIRLQNLVADGEQIKVFPSVSQAKRYVRNSLSMNVDDRAQLNAALMTHYKVDGSKLPQVESGDGPRVPWGISPHDHKNAGRRKEREFKVKMQRVRDDRFYTIFKSHVIKYKGKRHVTGK